MKPATFEQETARYEKTVRRVTAFFGTLSTMGLMAGVAVMLAGDFWSGLGVVIANAVGLWGMFGNESK